MNIAAKAAIYNLQSSSSFHLRTALFHSTPVLERKRRGFSFSYSRPNFSSRRHRKLHGREELLRNIRAYADSLFQGLNDDFEDDDPSSSKGPSWFRKQHSRGPRNSNGSRSKRWGKKGFDFCEDDVEVETIFRSAFGGGRGFYWSFINDEQPRQNRSSEHFWRHRRTHQDDDHDSSSESNYRSELDSVSERRTLGLSASGPLKLQDVKTAYRSCALKWHPDRHQGSSKAVAEEKFKVCSAAYESLCNKLEMA